MLVPHNALILVADGRKFLFLRNRGTLGEPVLAFEGGAEKESPSTAEQGTDRPGRAFASSGSARSAMAQTDFHQLDEDRFAAGVAEHLGLLAKSGDFDDLIVIAPPKCLAELRANFDKPVTSRIVAELAKDLTRHPIGEITQILAREGES